MKTLFVVRRKVICRRECAVISSVSHSQSWETMNQDCLGIGVIDQAVFKLTFNYHSSVTFDFRCYLGRCLCSLVP